MRRDAVTGTAWTGAQNTQSARPSSEQKQRLCGTVSRHPGHLTHREPLQIPSNQAPNVLHNQALKPLTNCPILKPPWLPWQHFYYVTREETYCSVLFTEGAHTSQKRYAPKRSKAGKHVAFNKSCFLIKLKPSRFHFCIWKSLSHNTTCTCTFDQYWTRCCQNHRYRKSCPQPSPFHYLGLHHTPAQ